MLKNTKWSIPQTWTGYQAIVSWFSIKGGFLKKRSPSQAMSSPEIKKNAHAAHESIYYYYLESMKGAAA